MATTSCTDLSLAYGIVSYPECSHRGICVNSKCICDAGWTGYADMQLSSGFDCDINIVFVQVLASLNVLVSGAVSAFVLYYAIKEDVFSEKNRYRLKSIVFLCFFLGNLLGCIQCLLKVIYPETQVVGGEFTQSLLMIFVSTLMFTSGSLFFNIMITFLKSYSRFFDAITRKSIIKTMERIVVSTYVLPGFVLFALISSICSAYVKPEESDYLSILVVLTFMIAYSVTGGNCLLLLHSFIREMGKYLESTKLNNTRAVAAERGRVNIKTGQIAPFSDLTNDVQRIYDKIKVAYYLGVPVIVAGIPLNLLFASWVFIRRKLVYLLMIELLTISPISAMFVFSLTTQSRKLGMISMNGVSAKINVVMVRSMRIHPKIDAVVPASAV